MPVRIRRSGFHGKRLLWSEARQALLPSTKTTPALLSLNANQKQLEPFGRG
jgi:hypothetical protein